ncbi:MAG TPA: tetratricopeptide repeat protein, partial [Hanamia sp.]|nr:tetratricopeptide repeat protein [Hanamia sp.]
MIFISMLIAAGCVSKTKEPVKIGNGNPKDLALQYLSQNQLDEAEAAFQQAIKKDPHDTASYIALTRLYLLRQNYTDAEDLAKQGLKVSADDTDLKLLLAKIYALKNEKEKASAVLKEVIEKNSKNVMAYYMLSELDSGNLSSQKNYLLKVQELAPANIVPLIALSELFAKTGKTDSSLFYLQSVKKIAPTFSGAADMAYKKSLAALQSNQPQQATASLEQFHELMKISPEYGTGLDEIEIP